MEIILCELAHDWTSSAENARYDSFLRARCLAVHRVCHSASLIVRLAEFYLFPRVKSPGYGSDGSGQGWARLRVSAALVDIGWLA